MAHSVGDVGIHVSDGQLHMGDSCLSLLQLIP